jgi:hypothetical protein
MIQSMAKRVLSAVRERSATSETISRGRIASDRTSIGQAV